jgi:hypothetical protein
LDEGVQSLLGRTFCAQGQVGHLLEVEEPIFEPEHHVLAGLLAGFCHVHRAHQAPAPAIHRVPVLFTLGLVNAEIGRKGVEAALGRGAHREQAEPKPPGHACPSGRDLRCHRQLHMRVAVGVEMKAGVVEFEPVAFLANGFASQEAHNYVERLFHHGALARGFETDHARIGLE